MSPVRGAGRPRAPGGGGALAALALAAVLAVAGPVLARAPAFPCSVLRSLPHDEEAFTQGLLLHQGEFIESTGLYGRSTLRRVDPETGRVRLRVALSARHFGEGAAICPPDGEPGSRLVQLTWKEGLALFYDPETLRPTGSRRLPGELWGLACAPASHGGVGQAGARLVLSDGSDVLRLLDPRTLAETGRLRVWEGARDAPEPVAQLNELEWHNGWILANVWRRDALALIRGDTGQVAAWLDLAPLRALLKSPRAEAANGVAVDRTGRRIFVTGKHWDAVFVLEMPQLLTRPPGHQP